MEKKSDDSSLLILIIRVMDALGNYGNVLHLGEFQHIISNPISLCTAELILSIFFSDIGSLEFDEWSSHRQAWKLESAAIIEPPINFIVSSHSKGKKR